MKWIGSRRLLVVLAALIVFAALTGLTFSRRFPVTFAENAAKDTVVAFQGLLYRALAAASAFADDVRSIWTVYEENRELRRTLFRYVRDVQRLNELEYENERLKEALRFTEEQKRMNRYVWRIAQVVSDSPDPYNRIVVINLGSKDGIREQMAVVASGGLVGLIERVHPFHSNVRLLTDLNAASPDSKAVSVWIRGKEDSTFGLIDDYDPTTGLLTMSKIDRNALVEKGDVVVTAGLGGVFPGGIVVGDVVSSEESAIGITKSAKVKPRASFRRLDYVFVVEVPQAEGVAP
ncbi:MAG: rod shape-determining protein MreC [Candidatus Reconcilbacillus cellulovorans]|uniref:Cell shape-determining protein MreC n=1 Tax=Candidatus Reconcilbacillus cellulovorans TaxID=1906605 RepID=A0A2A6DZK2_9BACL|nr:MAG: rod shape-determining protein MreC [Candidatus Reconcilbacillus cellulovorans]